MKPHLTALLSALMLAVLLIQPAEARSHSHHRHAYRAPASDNQLIEQGTYTNRQGNTVHRPAHTRNGKAPAGASARCGDGSYSFSQSARGTCSHHGGVATWLNGG